MSWAVEHRQHFSHFKHFQTAGSVIYFTMLHNTSLEIRHCCVWNAPVCKSHEEASGESDIIRTINVTHHATSVKMITTTTTNYYFVVYIYCLYFVWGCKSKRKEPLTFLKTLPLGWSSSSSLSTSRVPRQSLCGNLPTAYSNILSKVSTPGCSQATSLSWFSMAL